MPLCPKCSSEVAKTDTHCMDCGANLVEEREKEREVLREMSQAARMGGGPVVAAGASAGTVAAGEKSSDETRIRAFDKQEAERLTAERTTAWVTSGLTLIPGIGFIKINANDGFPAVLSVLMPAALRDNIALLFSAPAIGLMMLGLGIAGLLVGIGQTRLAVSATRAINQVRNNYKPDIVQVSAFTIAGLYVVALFCPPLGILIGLLFFFGRNPDLKHIGSTMMIISAALVVLLGANMLWKLAENLKSTALAPKSFWMEMRQDA